MLRHFVVTRLGLGVYDQHRLTKLIDLFEAVTLSSLARQKSQDFICLIAVDADMPLLAHDKLKNLLIGHSNFYLVPIDVTRLVNVHVANFDWVWDHYQDFILGLGLLIDPHDYVVTSVVDADDAWHHGVVETINQLAAKRIPGLREMENERGTWLRHSSGVAVTFPHGYVWFIAENKIWPLVGQEFLSMAVFVISRFSSGISACSCRHSKWRSYSDVLDFEVVPLETGSPMWVYTRHDEAVGHWDSFQAMPISGGVEQRLTDLYGIDLTKTHQWCSTYPRQQLGTSFSGKSAAEQFDRFFQIAILNRKLRTLERRAQNAPGLSAVSDEMARCEAERAYLIEVLRGKQLDAPQQVTEDSNPS